LRQEAASRLWVIRIKRKRLIHPERFRAVFPTETIAWCGIPLSTENVEENGGWSKAHHDRMNEIVAI
jgi:hypothetical protein